MLTQAHQKIFQSLDYVPFATQKEGHESDARFKALFAGARYGKSQWAAREVLFDVLTKDTRGWICGPTYLLASKEFRYIYQDLVVKLGFPVKRKQNVSYTIPGPQRLVFPWGAEVETKSEENQESLLGEEIDWLILSEGSRLKEETYDIYLRPRLGTRGGRVILPTTPHGYNWLYRRFYIPATDGNPLYWSKIAGVLENSKFSRQEYAQAKDELPEDIFLEQYEGQFVAYTGLIYRRFSRQANVIPPFGLSHKWRRVMAIDPHPKTATAILWMAIDEHGTWFLYDEMFQPNLTLHEIADHIRGREKSHGGPIDKRLIDPSAKYIDKLRGQTASIQMQLRREGINCIEADNKFESAYYTISEKLNPTPVFGDTANRKPNLYVFSTLKETINSFETCTWENQDDHHLIDCLKYISNDLPSRPWREDEYREIMIEESKQLDSLNPVTGY